MFSWSIWHACSLFEHRGSTILWYLPKRKLGVSVVFRSQWEKPPKPPLVVEFLCPLTPNATNWSTSHPEDKHIGLYTVCIWMCLIVCVIIRAHAHLFFCVWPHMPPGWSQRLGYVAYCISSWGGSWGCCAEALRWRAWFTVRRGPDVTGSVFWKTSSGPEGENNLPNPVWLCSLTPKSPNPNH